MPSLAEAAGVIPPQLLFALEAGALSATVFLLDWLLVVVGQQSYLRVTHGRRSPVFLCFWFVGGVVVGGLGSLIHLYEQTPQAAFIVALTWRTFFDQARKFSPGSDPEQK
jgi:hypothetical protein